MLLKLIQFILQGTMTIDEVLDLLTRFQDSTVQREREVFYCMISNLFEEYKYFPQYPEKELHITAQLFGGIIGEFWIILCSYGSGARNELIFTNFLLYLMKI